MDYRKDGEPRENQPKKKTLATKKDKGLRERHK